MIVEELASVPLTSSQQSPGSPLVSALAEDGAGGLWIGTVAGGLLHHRGGHVEHLGTGDGLGDDRGTALLRAGRFAALAGPLLWALIVDAGEGGAGITCLRDVTLEKAGA